jgi:hypothetical protein
MNLRDMLTGMGQQQMPGQPPMVDQGAAQFPVAGLPPAPANQQSGGSGGGGGGGMGDMGGMLQMIMSMFA